MSLAHAQAQVHAHLDWKPIEDWLGTQPFLLAEQGHRLVGVLACPPDPADTAWLRMLVFAEQAEASVLWQALWERARSMLVKRGVRVMAALSMAGWIDPLCQAAGFDRTHAVVVLLRENGPLPSLPQSGRTQIRPARPSDYAAIKAVDTAAFTSPWQMSPELMDLAIATADLITVSEVNGEIVGYQLTTPNNRAVHLARLAVLPAWQRQGIGAGLLAHLLEHYDHRGVRDISVNTQDSNALSLRLYQRFGFRPTGSNYPVYQCELPGTGKCG